jgi:tetratricopeptide (TPR) repeat protein
MMRAISFFILALCAIIPQFAFGHPNPANRSNDVSIDTTGSGNATRAAEYCQHGKYTEALNELESAMNSPASQLSYTWYVKGFIYKEIFKSSTDRKSKHDARNVAVDAFLHARALNDYRANEFNVDAPLRYLVSSYYSDALMDAGSCFISDLANCDELMSHFVSMAHQVGLDSDLHLRKADYEKTVGMRLFTLWLADWSQQDLYNEALKRMSSAIDHNPADCMSMYNRAVFHFKMSEAGRSNAISCDHEGELDIALSELHKAESVCPANSDILRAILNIYKMKQDTSMTDEYEKRIAGTQQNPSLKN